MGTLRPAMTVDAPPLLVDRRSSLLVDSRRLSATALATVSERRCVGQTSIGVARHRTHTSDNHDHESNHESERVRSRPLDDRRRCRPSISITTSVQ